MLHQVINIIILDYLIHYLKFNYLERSTHGAATYSSSGGSTWSRFAGETNLPRRAVQTGDAVHTSLTRKTLYNDDIIMMSYITFDIYTYI
jgi:hypothetical protein